jgi:hypothetical protein
MDSVKVFLRYGYERVNESINRFRRRGEAGSYVAFSDGEPEEEARRRDAG